MEVKISRILGPFPQNIISKFKQALDNIKPTSTDNEKTFSYSGTVIVPNRSSMSDECLWQFFLKIQRFQQKRLNSFYHFLFLIFWIQKNARLLHKKNF